MLFLRRETLPKTSLPSLTAGSVQFADVGGWASAASTRKIVLSRSTSTLSSGRYYVGVYNSAYARGSLGYRLTVNGAKNCHTSTLVASFDAVVDNTHTAGVSSGSQNASIGGEEDESLGVCSNGGVCNTQSSQLCTCTEGRAGYYCSLQPTRATLSPASALGHSNASSYVAFQTADNATMAVGDWVYYSFDVDDTTARAVEFVLLIQNDIAEADTPVSSCTWPQWRWVSVASDRIHARL